MDRQQAITLITSTFQSHFDKDQFIRFIKNLLNNIDESKELPVIQGVYIKEMFRDYIKSYERIGTYTAPEGKKLDILIVNLQKETTLERARTAQRNFIARYLKDRGEKDAGLIAFVSPDTEDWRFSFVKMEYTLVPTPKGTMKPEEEFTPARRYSYLVGKNEASHTAQSRMLPILTLEDENRHPTLGQIEELFSIEKATKEFFEKYRDLVLNVKEALDLITEKDRKVKQDFAAKGINTIDFAKKLLGQIVFLYFLQKKGWFGVERDANWGTGPKNFLRQLFEGKHRQYKNLFKDVLEPLFYEALALPRQDDFWRYFNCKIPFLNGGLFDPIGDYNWVHTDILLPDELFSNQIKTPEGDTGTGIFDVFDRYNFTVKEDEPLEKEVAIDPEMLGKVFENLLEVKDRKTKGTFYTPREIVHYMCQEGLINYLTTKLDGKVSKEDIEFLIRQGETVLEHEARVEKEGRETKYYPYKMPESIRANAKLIDDILANLRVCDPACGSGAFLVGMMTEIVKARKVLDNYIKSHRTGYDFKFHAIQNCLYGVDIDPSAVEIAKLRLWLSLIVDEEDIRNIRPLPNLDYKIMQGNSLIEEYEGIKLIDERFFQKEDSKNQIISRLKTEQAKLQKEYFELLDKKPINNLKKTQIEQKVKEITKEIDRVRNEQKSDKENLDFFLVSQAKQMAGQLLEKQKQFFNIAQKEEKAKLKQEIKQLTWELIEMTLREEGKANKIKEVEQFKDSNTAPFFLWHLHFAEVFLEKGGFDIIVANPPYIQLQSNEGALADLLEPIGYQTFSRMGDIYCLFYEKAHRLLKDKGVSCYITSNKWMRTAYGEKLRKYFTHYTKPLMLIDLGPDVFDAATVDTNILVFSKSEPVNSFYGCTLQDKLNLPISDFVKLNSIEIPVPQNGNIWEIRSPLQQQITQKIEKYGIPLKDWNIQIYRGVLTGYNEAFIIDDITKNKLISADPKNKGIIKPLIRGRDTARYTAELSDNWLIATFPALKLDIEQYRAVRDYLISFGKQRLEQSGKALPGGLKARKKTDHKWFETQDPIAYYPELTKEKIIWKRIGSIMRFCYDNSGAYCLDSTCFATGEKIKYLLGLLNSKLCLYELSRIAPKTGTGDMIISVQALEPLRIPIPNAKQEEAITAIVNKILAITKDDNYLENETKQKQVAAYERQIDQMVYKLYDLTPEEIEIVEGTNSK